MVECSLHRQVIYICTYRSMLEKVLLVLNHKEIVCHILACFILMWLL